VKRKLTGRESAPLIRDTVSDTGMYVPDGHGYGHAAVFHLFVAAGLYFGRTHRSTIQSVLFTIACCKRRDVEWGENRR
jgi:hypothetical protein